MATGLHVHLLTVNLVLSCLIGLSNQVLLLTLSTAGLLVQPYCKGTFPEGSSQPTLTWEFEGQQLSVNGTRTADTTNRIYVYHSRITNQERAFRCYLDIQRPMKSDEGNYTCTATYYIGNAEQMDKETIFVPIHEYLPPPDYPKCSASSSVVYVGDAVTFSCDPGDSNPPVDVTLELQGPEGTDLENLPNITKQMTLHNNNSHFVCYMTSKLFRTMNQCSIGPIIVHEKSSEQNGVHDTATLSATADATAKSKSPVKTATTLTFTLGITIGLIGAFMICFIFTIIVLLLKRSFLKRKTTAPANQINRSPSIQEPAAHNTQPEQAPYAVIYDTTIARANRESYAVPYDTTATSNQPDHASYAHPYETTKLATPNSNDQEPYAVPYETRKSSQPVADQNMHGYQNSVVIR